MEIDKNEYLHCFVSDSENKNWSLMIAILDISCLFVNVSESV